MNCEYDCTIFFLPSYPRLSYRQLFIAIDTVICKSLHLQRDVCIEILQLDLAFGLEVFFVYLNLIYTEQSRLVRTSFDERNGQTKGGNLEQIFLSNLFFFFSSSSSSLYQSLIH